MTNMFTPSPSVPFLIFSMHNLNSIIGCFFCTNKKKTASIGFSREIQLHLYFLQTPAINCT